MDTDLTGTGDTKEVARRRKRASRVLMKPRPRPVEVHPDPGEERMAQSPQRTPEHDYRYQIAVAPTDKAALDALINDAATTNEEILHWLAKRGYHVSLAAVLRHRRVLEQLLRDASASSAMSSVVMRVSAINSNEIHAAMVEQSLTQSLYQESQRKEMLDGDSWLRIRRIVGPSIDSRIGLEKLRNLTTARTASTSSAARNLLRAITARQVADRVRDALAGPSPSVSVTDDAPSAPGQD